MKPLSTILIILLLSGCENKQDEIKYDSSNSERKPSVIFVNTTPKGNLDIQIYLEGDGPLSPSVEICKNYTGEYFLYEDDNEAVPMTSEPGENRMMAHYSMRSCE